MKFVRYYIFFIAITGSIVLIRFILSALFGLFMTNPEVISTIIAVITVLVLSIWYIDWNMRR